MSSAIVTFPGVAAIKQSRKSRYEQGDTTYWRDRRKQFEREQRQESCRCCLGTGEFQMYIDEPPMPCPRCQ